MSKKCIQLADIDQSVSCADLDNIAGTVDELIYGYYEDVASWPDLPAPTQEDGSMDFETAGAWNGDLVMKAGCRAYKMAFTEETGELTFTDEGETGAEHVKMELSLVRSKLTKTIFGFENATRARRMFFIIRDKNGNYYLMGDSVNAARKVAADASTTGKTTADHNRVPMKFSYVCPRKLMYTGDVENILKETN